ncbi:nucleotidyl transferase AbiEii/AbiGii toxin family protein [Gaoshiqia sp. Z1-71]|uniref:nucleotidyl transferase AbiEii/AbiGii toxin family protein n=1 Tax=Gaoshiqia hydrogeniformans TaxID=3290090 RepID=UPI003BF7732F
MILQKEIITLAAKHGVVKSTIDKDWALGHFLDAIYSVGEIRENLIFKGGTCLRKCYIPDYRFSEDLDFTSNNQNFKLKESHLAEITSLLFQRVGMLTHIESLKDLRYSDQLVGYEAIVKFWGADHPRNETPPPPQRWQTKIKMEIILYESLLFDIQHNDLVHGYSDTLTENAKRIPCYSIEEVLSEKMRALVQRSYTAPRDLYDLWYLSRHYKDVDLKNLEKAFLKKMEFKGHTFSGINQLLNPENDRPLKTAWKNSLGHQISGELPEYESVKQVLKDWFYAFLVNE